MIRLVKVRSKTAEHVSCALINSLEPMSSFVETLTADNGKEFTHHQKISNRLKAGLLKPKIRLLNMREPKGHRSGISPYPLKIWNLEAAE